MQYFNNLFEPIGRENIAVITKLNFIITGLSSSGGFSPAVAIRWLAGSFTIFGN